MSKKEEREAELKAAKERADRFNQNFSVGTEVAVVQADKSRKIMILNGTALARFDAASGKGLVEAMVGPCMDCDPKDEQTVLVSDIRPRSIQRKKATDALRVVLTPEERMKAANEAADAVAAVQTQKADLDSMKSSINAQIKMKESEISAKSELVRNGYEIRPVELSVVYDYDLGRVQRVRKDTGEIIEDRMIQDSERNAEPPVLFIVEPQETVKETVEEPAKDKTAPGPEVQKAQETTPAGSQGGFSLSGGEDTSNAGAGSKDDVKAAFEVLKETKRAGATSLARKMNVSSRRAIQLLDALQAEGIVGPSKADGSPRDILVDLDSYEPKI